MPEKTMITIDSGLVIPEGSEKVFENQHVRLEAGIECKGTLIFRNCIIEPCAKLGSTNGRKPVCKPGCISMGIDGKLEMDGCEVIHPGPDFLSSWNMMIKNTSFLINPCPDILMAATQVYNMLMDHFHDVAVKYTNFDDFRVKRLKLQKYCCNIILYISYGIKP